MKNCKGLFGRIFGHCFVSRIVKHYPPRAGFNIDGGYGGVAMIDKLCHKEYIVVCKRCGVRK